MTEKIPRILVVEDDSTIREVIETALRTSYEVRSLASGIGVSEMIDSYEPNLLLLDINLPGTDGFSISEDIRKKRNPRVLPILFMTVRGDDTTFLKGLESGGNAVIVKPFDMPGLRARIAALLTASES